MTSLFVPEVPQRDPKVALQQRDEQRRAEAARLSATQDQLVQETKLRGRASGLRSLLGSFGSGGSYLGSN